MATEVQTKSQPMVLQAGGPVISLQHAIPPSEPSVLVLYEKGQEQIVEEIAGVLGQQWNICRAGNDAVEQSDIVVGLEETVGPHDIQHWRDSRTVLSTHCLDTSNHKVGTRSLVCNYEYLYTTKPFYRRDLARFLALVLGQSNPHKELARKAKTTLISTTFPDVHAALPNLDILSVGADAVELRVDLLKDTLPDGSSPSVPSLQYTGEQLMLLRQRTELPIIFTTRCTRENGRFPMENPDLFFQYLHRAMQWGCEYIDVELWLPEHIRQELSRRKGNSKIISAFHDFSGTFKWTSAEAQKLFEDGSVYGDVVKMIALVNSMQENYELEYFRSVIQSTSPRPPFSGLNMGPMGQLSRALNRIFTPITHPLLPMVAAPGQLSAAEINSALHSMGQMPKLDMYGIGNVRSTGQAMFFEKCFNELSLPHQLVCMERSPGGSLEAITRQESFGGAFLNPPLATSAAPFLPKLSDAAAVIGQVDTILIQASGDNSTLVGDNATWKAIRATLCRDFVPTAYKSQAALVLASHESQAAAAIFALESLNIGPIYTIGFKASGALSDYVVPFRGLEDLKKVGQPSVIISALRAEKSLVVNPLLKHYRASYGQAKSAKVFLDLSNGGPRKGDPEALATSLGWTAYGIPDVNAWTTVETLRLLVGQNVPHDFVRLASGRSLY